MTHSPARVSKVGLSPFALGLRIPHGSRGLTACTLGVWAGAAPSGFAETCADLQMDIRACLYGGGGWEVLIFQNKLFGLLALS